MSDDRKKKSKAERARDREIIGLYHKKVTEDALEPLFQHFLAWKNGELHYGDLTEHIHKFHKENQKIWSTFNYHSSNDAFFLLQAKKELDLLTEEEIEEFRPWLERFL